jgi:hypothetical protein
MFKNLTALALILFALNEPHAAARDVRKTDIENVRKHAPFLNSKDKAHVKAYMAAPKAERTNRDYYVRIGLLPPLGGAPAAAPPAGMVFNPRIIRGGMAYDHVLAIVKQHLTDIGIDVTKNYNVETGMLYQFEHESYPKTRQQFFDYQDRVSSPFFKGCLAYTRAFHPITDTAKLLHLLTLDLRTPTPDAQILNQYIFDELMGFVADRIKSALDLGRAPREIADIFHLLENFNRTVQQLLAFDVHVRKPGTPMRESVLVKIREAWANGIKTIARRLVQLPRTPGAKIKYPAEPRIEHNAQVSSHDPLIRKRVVRHAIAKLLDKARADGDSAALIAEIDRKMRGGARGGGDRAESIQSFTDMIRTSTEKNKTSLVFLLDLSIRSRVDDLKEFAARNIVYVLFDKIENSPDFKPALSTVSVVDIIKLVDNLTGYGLVRNPPPAPPPGGPHGGGAPEADARGGDEKAAREEELRNLRGRPGFDDAKRNMRDRFRPAAPRP